MLAHKKNPPKFTVTQAEPTTAQLGWFMGKEQTIEEEGNEGVAKLKNPAIDERLGCILLNARARKTRYIQNNQRRHQHRR